MFKYLNANPDNCKEPDCVIRAISLALRIPYNVVLRMLNENGDIYTCDDLCVMCYSKLLSDRFGLTSKNGRRRTIGEVAEEYCDDVLIIRTNGHLTCSIYGDVYDIWDCRGETCDIFWVVR